MKTAGIVCEYNPFHRGHEYHVAETRRRLGDDCGIVCAMSGNFVQRGDAAIFPKHARAEAAVRCGADLVIELPLFWAMAPAEKFATGAVSLLAATGVVTHISFGSESADLPLLESVADALLSGRTEEKLREELKTGVSFASARERAVEDALGALGQVMKSPNDILAVEYLKAIKRRQVDIIPMSIKREGAEHDGIGDGKFLSASAIRRGLLRGEYALKAVPEAAAEIFEREIKCGRMVDIRKMDGPALYRLRTMKKADFEALPDNSEGLHNRIMRAASLSASIGDVVDMAKSKRYPAARIRRMVMSAYLGVTREDGKGLPEYISVLAMNERGMELLAEMKNKASLPVITKPASARELPQSAAAAYEKCATADDIYALAFTDARQRSGGQTWKTSPVVVK